ncbi:MAG TPA: hypothetical protein VFZ34_26575 [Blastocatellia bacterium]|nr:hypothetical protein [Blastocatellia bacterium]
MSLKFQTRKWDVEITWEQMTLTPLGTTKDVRDTRPENPTDSAQTNAANYFLFNLIEQIFAPSYKQEHLSQ